MLSVLTAMFVHAGWLHLLGNMLFLLVFGNNVEDRFRKIPYLIFYVACGYVAAYGFAFVHPGSVEPLVGASGAIAGVLGAYLALYPRARVWSLVPFLFFIPLKIPAWLVLGLWFVLQWAYAVGGIGGGGAVAYVAHVFGFLAGLLVGLAVRAASSGATSGRRVSVGPWQRTRGCLTGCSRGAPPRRTAGRGCGPCWTPRRRWPGRWNGPGSRLARAAAVTTAAAGTFDAGALGKQAALSGNPVPALVAALRRAAPAEAAETVHRGATSQDIIDTAAMLLARGALDAMAADLAAAADGCARLAAAHRDTLMIGRTLLQQAVPVTFGLVAAGWLTGLDEAGETVARVRARRLAVQFGGAAGTLASLGADGPAVARLLAEELDLAQPVLPWHTDRSRIVEVAAACAVAAAALAKIARDVTLLAQSEVAEVREGGGGSGGKRRADPRRCRTSRTRWPPSPSSAAPAGCPAWSPPWPPLPSRSISGPPEPGTPSGSPSPTCSRVTGSAASWAVDLTGGLVVDPARMRANLDATRGLPLAERVAGLLAPALGRAAAHDLVARASAHAVAVGGTLRESLLDVPELAGWDGRCGRHQRPDRRRPGPRGLPRLGRGVHRRGAGRACAAVLADGLIGV